MGKERVLKFRINSGTGGPRHKQWSKLNMKRKKRLVRTKLNQLERKVGMSSRQLKIDDFSHVVSLVYSELPYNPNGHHCSCNCLEEFNNDIGLVVSGQTVGKVLHERGSLPRSLVNAESLSELNYSDVSKQENIDQDGESFIENGISRKKCACEFSNCIAYHIQYKCDISSSADSERKCSCSSSCTKCNAKHFSNAAGNRKLSTFSLHSKAETSTNCNDPYCNKCNAVDKAEQIDRVIKARQRGSLVSQMLGLKHQYHNFSEKIDTKEYMTIQAKVKRKYKKAKVWHTLALEMTDSLKTLKVKEMYYRDKMDQIRSGPKHNDASDTNRSESTDSQGSTVDTDRINTFIEDLKEDYIKTVIGLQSDSSGVQMGSDQPDLVHQTQAWTDDLKTDDNKFPSSAEISEQNENGLYVFPGFTPRVQGNDFRNRISRSVSQSPRKIMPLSTLFEENESIASDAEIDNENETVNETKNGSYLRESGTFNLQDSNKSGLSTAAGGGNARTDIASAESGDNNRRSDYDILWINPLFDDMTPFEDDNDNELEDIFSKTWPLPSMLMYGSNWSFEFGYETSPESTSSMGQQNSPGSLYLDFHDKVQQRPYTISSALIEKYHNDPVTRLTHRLDSGLRFGRSSPENSSEKEEWLADFKEKLTEQQRKALDLPEEEYHSPLSERQQRFGKSIQQAIREQVINSASPMQSQTRNKEEVGIGMENGEQDGLRSGLLETVSSMNIPTDQMEHSRSSQLDHSLGQEKYLNELHSPTRFIQIGGRQHVVPKKTFLGLNALRNMASKHQTLSALARRSEENYQVSDGIDKLNTYRQSEAEAKVKAEKLNSNDIETRTPGTVDDTYRNGESVQCYMSEKFDKENTENEKASQSEDDLKELRKEAQLAENKKIANRLNFDYDMTRDLRHLIIQQQISRSPATSYFSVIPPYLQRKWQHRIKRGFMRGVYEQKLAERDIEKVEKITNQEIHRDNIHKENLVKVYLPQTSKANSPSSSRSSSRPLSRVNSKMSSRKSSLPNIETVKIRKSSRRLSSVDVRDAQDTESRRRLSSFDARNVRGIQPLPFDQLLHKLEEEVDNDPNAPGNEDSLIDAFTRLDDRHKHSEKDAMHRNVIRLATNKSVPRKASIAMEIGTSRTENSVSPLPTNRSEGRDVGDEYIPKLARNGHRNSISLVQNIAGATIKFRRASDSSVGSISERRVLPPIS